MLIYTCNPHFTCKDIAANLRYIMHCLIRCMESALSKKNDVQIFERRSGYKIVKHNVPGGSDFCLFLPHSYDLILRGLLPKNLQNVAKGGTAPRLVVPTMTVCQHGMYRHPNCYTPLIRIYSIFALK